MYRQKSWLEVARSAEPDVDAALLVPLLSWNSTGPGTLVPGQRL